MPETTVTLDLWIVATSLAVAGILLVALASWTHRLRRQVAFRERERQAAYEKLKAFFNAIPDPVWIKSPEGTYQECNDHMIELLEREREAVIGQRDDALFPPEGAGQMLSTDDEAVRTGKVLSYLTSLASPGRPVRWLDIRKAPLYDADGRITGIVGVARDVTEVVRSQKALCMWAHAFEHAGIGITIHDVRTRAIVAVNPVFARERGFTPEEMAGMPIERLYPGNVRAELPAGPEHGNSAEHEVLESVHITRDGKKFPVLIDRSSFHDEKGDARFTVSYVQDLTARKRAEDELRLAEVAFQSSAALVITDENGAIKRVNQAFLSLTGYLQDEITGRNLMGLIAPDKCLARSAELLESLRQTQHWESEHSMRVHKGNPRIVRTSISPVFDEAGGIRHYVVAIIDLTHEHEARASIRRVTFSDPLTGLSNRSYLNLRLHHLLERNDSRGGALLLIDIDHFKRVNDLHGHRVGDMLIVRIAERLRSLMKREYVLSRFSGGTFALLVPSGGADGASPQSAVADLAASLRASLGQPFPRNNPDTDPISITVSIGWTDFERTQKSAESILREAELAMYEAKAEGRDSVRRFEAEMERVLQRREALASDLARVTQEAPEEIELYLQLQSDRQGYPVGAEVLARWNHRNGCMILPGQFIGLAEERGLIVPLGTLILRQACRLLSEWSRRPAFKHLSLSVNISSMQLSSPDFVAVVTGILKETGIAPRKLTLEITETAIMESVEETGDALASLRRLGVRISLDDFGIGYSSLHYLARLPLDQLKIDRSFVQRLAENGNEMKIAQAIIGLARGLGLEVIAEGIETDAQGQFLLEHGCDCFQGYLLASPLPIPAFQKMLEGMLGAGVPLAGDPNARASTPAGEEPNPRMAASLQTRLIQ